MYEISVSDYLLGRVSWIRLLGGERNWPGALSHAATLGRAPKANPLLGSRVKSASCFLLLPNSALLAVLPNRKHSQHRFLAASKFGSTEAELLCLLHTKSTGSTASCVLLLTVCPPMIAPLFFRFQRIKANPHNLSA